MRMLKMMIVPLVISSIISGDVIYLPYLPQSLWKAATMYP